MNVNLDRIRAWCTALAGGQYRQGFAALIDLDHNTGRVRHCAEGVAADLAWRDGVVSLISHAVTRDLGFTRSDAHVEYSCLVGGLVTPFVSAWLGWDMATETVDLRRCPDPLRRRIRAVVERNVTTEYEELATLRGCDPDRWEVWALNDLGVPLADIAAALRCHHSVDLDLVPELAQARDYTLAGAA